MGTPKDDAIDLTEKLAALESDNGISPNNDFHAALKAALEEHGHLLGFDEQDIADIEAAGTAARGGGTGKDPA